MRDMTFEEIMEFIKEWTWGTLIAVEDNRPYAIELSYGTDGKYIYCGSMPGGRMARCISKNPNVVFKICDADKYCKKWRAVIIESYAERLTNPEDILYSVRLIAKQRNMPENSFDALAERLAKDPQANCLRIPIKVVGGRTNR